MPARDLPLLLAAAQAAGAEALRFSGPKAKRWDKADGAGPVTEADLAVNASLEARLRAERPDYGWLSEETEDDAQRLGAERTFIIDPIDGTRSFVEGSSTWAISVAVAEQGEITAGVVYLPARDMLYAAGKGMGTTLNGDPVRVCPKDGLEGARVLAAKPNFDPRNWQGGLPAIRRDYRPSLAYRLSLVGQGRFEAMMTLRASWEWDIAAGSLIVTEAGGNVSTRGGAPLRFNKAHPVLDGVVAGSPQVQAGLLKHLGVKSG